MGRFKDNESIIQMAKKIGLRIPTGGRRTSWLIYPLKSNKIYIVN